MVEVQQAMIPSSTSSASTLLTCESFNAKSIEVHSWQWDRCQCFAKEDPKVVDKNQKLSSDMKAGSSKMIWSLN